MSAFVGTASTMLLALAGSAIAAAAIAGSTGALAPVMAASLGLGVPVASSPPPPGDAITETAGAPQTHEPLSADAVPH